MGQRPAFTIAYLCAHPVPAPLHDLRPNCSQGGEFAGGKRWRWWEMALRALDSCGGCGGVPRQSYFGGGQVCGPENGDNQCVLRATGGIANPGGRVPERLVGVVLDRRRKADGVGGEPLAAKTQIKIAGELGQEVLGVARVWQRAAVLVYRRRRWGGAGMPRNCGWSRGHKRWWGRSGRRRRRRGRFLLEWRRRWRRFLLDSGRRKRGGGRGRRRGRSRLIWRRRGGRCLRPQHPVALSNPRSFYDSIAMSLLEVPSRARRRASIRQRNL